jgi:hypothetical protein
MVKLCHTVMLRLSVSAAGGTLLDGALESCFDNIVMIEDSFRTNFCVQLLCTTPIARLLRITVSGTQNAMQWMRTMGAMHIPISRAFIPPWSLALSEEALTIKRETGNSRTRRYC